MISIKGQKALKAGFTLILLTLVIGNVSALEWEDPSGDLTAVPFTPNVSDLGTDVDGVNFSLVDGPRDDIEDQEATIGGDFAYYSEFNPGDGNSGDYTLEAESYDSSGNVVDSISKDVTVDGEGPEISFPSDEFVRNDPDITVELADEHTGISGDDTYSATVDNNAQVEGVNGFDECSSGNTCTVDFEIDTGDLSNGDNFNLDVTAEDRVGNENTADKVFTFDDSFQADEPEFTVEDADENNNVDLSGDVNLDVTVGNIDEEESDVQVKCLVDGDEVSTTDWEDEEDFSCEIPSEEVDDDTADISVGACDRAGNCDQSSEDSYTFDSMSPEIESFSTSRDYDVYSGDFDVNYEAFDSASGVEELEYFFYAGTSPGDGQSVAYDGEGEFKVDTALLDGEGEQTVYLRARDAVGHWSDVQSIDFEFHPDATPQVSLEASDDFSVEAGSSGDIDVVVENTGKLLIQSVTVEASSQLVNGSKTVEDLTEGDSANAEFEISPTENQTGLWNVSFNSESPEASDSVEVLVQANSEQRENVDSELETYSARLEQIKSNVSELQSSGLNQELNDSLNSGVSSFVQQVETAQSFQESGEYYRALSAIESIDASYEAASSTVDEVRSDHEANEFRQTLMMAFLGLLIIGGAGGVFLYTSDRKELEIEALNDLDVEIPELGGIGEKVSEKVEAFKEKLAEEEEEVEEKFNGFN